MMSEIAKRVAMGMRVAGTFSAKLNVVAPNSSKNGLSIPENFDVFKEYKQPGIKVYSGANDWESSPTCFMLLKQDYRGEGERLWVELIPPEGCDDFGDITDDEKERGLTGNEKDKLIREHGDAFLKKWEDAARAVHEASYESAKGLPNTLKKWAEALRDTVELHDYVAMSGSDRTYWEKTGLLRDDKSV